jgi:hypothetical protein
MALSKSDQVVRTAGDLMPQPVWTNSNNGGSMKMNSVRGLIGSAALATFLAGCPFLPTDNGNVGKQTAREATKQALESIPAWAAFSPPIPKYDGRALKKTSLASLAPKADPIPEDPIFNSETVGGIKYDCTTVPYSISNNPSEIVTLQPDSDALYPGALLQGGSYVLGSLQPLVINDRTPVEISIDLLTEGVREVIPDPTVGNVREAIGRMVQRAKAKNTPVAGAGMGSFEETNNSESFALKADISAKYLRAKLNASFSFERNASERIYNATIIQKAFNVTVQPPESIDAWFNPSFTKDKFDALVSKGAIGVDSPPIYVSSVTYGRMLFLNVKVFTEGQKIEGSLSGSFSGGVFNVSGKTSTDSQLKSFRTEIRVVGIGASGKVLDSSVVTDGNLKAYLKEPATLDEMAPISYALRDLRTKVPAAVGETSRYDVKSCAPVLPNKVGERWLVAVDGVLLDNPGDGGDGDIYGDLSLNGIKFFDLPASRDTQLNRGVLIGDSRSVNYPGIGTKTGNGMFDAQRNFLVKDYATLSSESVTIEGHVWDEDTFSDDSLLNLRGGNQIVLRYPFQPGKFVRSPGGTDGNRLLYRLVKLCNLVLDPATNQTRPENNQCLTAASELAKP